MLANFSLETDLKLRDVAAYEMLHQAIACDLNEPSDE
jgi:hypothetical protein